MQGQGSLLFVSVTKLGRAEAANRGERVGTAVRDACGAPLGPPWSTGPGALSGERRARHPAEGR
ncbi:hypothetical protein ISF6_2327 [Piscinibacter sakaiensis]|uniref:Uncharacterized protein n=1 Tax=Piscinibacter sakaiensis TaxID=1547922 RepID=A0A0K8P1E8_PISS1|nr:hypothetical protein ISF6_2327 [Piscinibacter sakaiensis]